MRLNEFATGMLAGDVAVVFTIAAKQKVKRDKKGVPVVPNAKNADGTAKNALDVKDNIHGR